MGRGEGSPQDGPLADREPMMDTAPNQTEEMTAVSPHRTFIQRWRKPAAITALGVSLMLHVVLLILAALIVFSSGGDGSGDLGESVEFAVMTAEDLAQLQDASLDMSAPSVEDLPVPDAPAIDLEVTQIESDLTGETAELEAQLGGGDVDDGSIGVTGAGGGSANFFGLEASGSRFAYVVDVSGSMSSSGKIDRLRIELVRSLEGLLESAEFLVCLYNGDAYPLGGKTDWVDATDSGKRWANRQIETILPAGGTNPLPGFKLVFARKPRPDAIYFMTDGEFNPEVAMLLRFENAEHRIPIHCITFGSRGAEDAMKQIAKDSGGTYTHVSGSGE